MTPRGRSGSRPWRPLVTLVMIIVVMLVSVAGADALHPGSWHQQFKIALGLDLSGGTELVLQAQTPQGQPPSAAEMNQAQSILLSRVNGTGATGAQVQQQGGNLINVSVPKASAQVLNLVGGTAQMRFRQVLLEQPPAGAGPSSSPTASFGDASLVNAATMKLFSKLTCAPGSNGNVNDAWKATVGYTPQQAQWDDAGRQVVSCDASGAKYVLNTAVFTGTDVTSANAGLLPNSSQWAVNLTLDGAATKSFGALATHQFDNYFPNIHTSQDDAVLDQTAMALDGDVVSAPQTADALTSGQVQVSGPPGAPFTQAQADQLSDQLKYGALPLSFAQLSVKSISASAGPRLAGRRPDRGRHRADLDHQLPIRSTTGGWASCRCPACSSPRCWPAWRWYCSAGTRTSPWSCPPSPDWSSRSVSRRTRSSCSSNGCGTRCGTARRCARR